MKIAMLILGLLVLAPTVDAQLMHLEPEKSDSGGVYLSDQQQTYHFHQSRLIGHFGSPMYAQFRAFFVFDKSGLPDIESVTRVWMDYATDQTHSGDTVLAFILRDWQRDNPQEAYQSIEEGVPIDTFPTPASENIVLRSFEIPSPEAVQELYDGESIAIGFILMPYADHCLCINSVRLHIEYCGGATAILTINNVIEPGVQYTGNNNLVRIGSGEFVEPPIVRDALLGGNIICEVWNARYDSTFSGNKMKPFLWENDQEFLPPTFVVTNFDTSQTEYTSYAEWIIPFSITSENEYYQEFNVEVQFFDPWRITQTDSIQTRVNEYISHATPYETANDNTTFGVFKDIDQLIYEEVYSFRVPIAVDSLGTTIVADTIDYGDKVLAGIRVAPPNSAMIGEGEKDGHHMRYDIVFTGDSSNVILQYKRHLNGSPTLSKPNQRNICCDYFGTYHLVYADQGEIWYTESGDGYRWIPEIRISDGKHDALNPSMISPQGIYGATYRHNGTFVTYAQEGKVVFAVIDTNKEVRTIWVSEHQAPNEMLHPAVHSAVMCGKGLAVIVWEGDEGLRYTATQNDLMNRFDHYILENAQHVPSTSSGSEYPSLNHRGHLSWVHQDSVFIMSHLGECGDEISFSWLPNGRVAVHEPQFGGILSPPSLANEFHPDHPVVYIVYASYDTTSPPPGYQTIPGTHAVVVQSVNLNNLPPTAIRKIVSPSWVPVPYIDENGNPLFNIANPSVGAFSDEMGGRAAYNNIQSCNVVDVISFTPTLDAVFFSQSDGRNPNVVMRAKLGELKDALIITDTAWSATVITSAEHMNKKSNAKYDEVLLVECRQAKRDDGRVWLRPKNCRIRSEERVGDGVRINSGIREVLFFDASGVLALDYCTKTDEAFMLVYAMQRAEDPSTASMSDVVLRAKLMPAEGWQTVRWVLNEPRSDDVRYFVEVKTSVCEAPDWSVYLFPHREDNAEARCLVDESGSGVLIHSISPNPSNGFVNIEYTVSQDVTVRVYIQDASGKVRAEVENSFRSAGTYILQAHLDGYPSGWYTMVAQTNTGNSTKKFIMIR